MKLKIISIVAIFVVITMIALVGIPISIWSDGLQTDKDFDKFILEFERGNITPSASANGKTVWLSYPNLSRTLTLLSPIERKRVLFPAKRPEISDISIILSDSAAFYIVDVTGGDSRDRALLYYENGNKKRCYSITGYGVLKTIGTAVSPEGFNGENIEKE